MLNPAPTRRTLLAGLAASLTLAATARRAQAGTQAPDWGAINLLDSENRSFCLAEVAEPLTLVTLWANWCGVCLQELDTVEAIRPAISQNRLRVILLSHPDDWSRNQAVIRSRGLTLPTARISAQNNPSLLQNALLSADGTFYVPRSILFSRATNQVVWSHVGGLDWRQAETVNRLRPWLA